ncbi:hypothetical protein RZE82_02485 [Mollicutes bacterium LVI A0039]|nr:hypothetical protein RZE82_02485 [Mollicutes bacterium LVI A0039]
MNKDTVRIEEFLLIISLLVIVIGLLWQAGIADEVELDPAEHVQNMLAAPPIPANTYLENYSLYVPNGYEYEVSGNTVVIYDKKSIITFYLGQGVELKSEFFDKMNTDLEKLYGQSISNDGVITYTYAWKYDENHTEILLGQNDSYIVAIYPDNEISDGISDITLMFNSYQAANG